MAEKVAISKSKITAVADAIREKTETSEGLGLDAMPQAIRDIKSGGDDSFISGVDMPTSLNYDGEEIKAYLYYSEDVVSIDCPNVKKVGAYAFWTQLPSTNAQVEHLNIQNVTEIGTYAFYNRLNSSNSDDTVVNLSLPRLTNFWGYVFYGCTAIKTVSIPEMNNSIQNSCFYGCKNLESIYAPKAKGIYTSAFADCLALDDVVFPSVESVQGTAFSNCAALTKLKFEKLKSLSSGAFRLTRGAETGLTIDIDGTISSLPSQSFQGTTSNSNNLAAVVLRKNSLISLSNASVFDYSWIKTETDKGFVYVPDELVDTYKGATNWSTFASKIKPLSEYVEVTA